jgi:hypothetical protein
LLTRYCSGDRCENKEVGGACGIYGRGGEAVRKRQFGRTRHRWEGVQEWGGGLGLDWSG